MAGPTTCSWESCRKPKVSGPGPFCPDVTLVATGLMPEHHLSIILSLCMPRAVTDRTSWGLPELYAWCVCVCGGGWCHICAVHMGVQGHLAFLAEPLGQWELCAQVLQSLHVSAGDIHRATPPQHPASPYSRGPKH